MGRHRRRTDVTISEAIQKGVRERDLGLIAGVVDQLRFRMGRNYNEIFEIAKRCVPSLTSADWENLCYCADMEGY